MIDDELHDTIIASLRQIDGLLETLQTVMVKIDKRPPGYLILMEAISRKIYDLTIAVAVDTEGVSNGSTS